MLKPNFRRFSFTSLLLLFAALGYAQTGQGSMEDTMRSHDKIYVVLAVCLVILIFVILYLIRIDVKISKQEKNNS